MVAPGVVTTGRGSGASSGCPAVGWCGRRLGDDASPADFTLVLADGPGAGVAAPAGAVARLLGAADTADTLDALHEVRRRADAGERVEVACRGGVGRTGTALAALAVLDGLRPGDAVHWVRRPTTGRRSRRRGSGGGCAGCAER